MKLFFDIETLPAPQNKEPLVRELYEKYLLKKSTGVAMSYDQFLASTALDGGLGRILCIGYAMDDAKAEVLHSSQETSMLKKFWELAASASLVVGHNVFEFDLPFIYQRSVIHSIEPTCNLFPRRYTNDVVFDTYFEWTRWHNSKGSLDYLAKVLGFPTSKQGIDGSQVYEFFKAGKVKEILEYCQRDVELTRQVYKKLAFED